MDEYVEERTEVASIVARSFEKLVQDDVILISDVRDSENLYVTADFCTLCDTFTASLMLDEQDEDLSELIGEMIDRRSGEANLLSPTIAHFCAEHEGEMTLTALMVTV